MKHFVLLHNLIMMTQAHVMNSHERWFRSELEVVVAQLVNMIDFYWREGKITDYQSFKLGGLANQILDLVPHE